MFHVSIAGFYFKIVFKKIITDKSPLEFARQRLMSEVVYFLSSFVSTSIPKKIDASIYFEDDLSLERVKRKTDNSNFVLHYKRKNNNLFITNYHTSIAQFSLLLEDVLNELLLKNDGCGVHASANIINKKAYLFLGKSGAGKSTISALLGKYFRILADDNIILRRINGDYYVFQTPFYEKSIDIWKSPHAFPLSKVFFLHKGKSMHKKGVKPLSIEKLLKKQILGFPESDENIAKLIKSKKNKPGFYNLWFTKNEKELYDFFTRTNEAI